MGMTARKITAMIFTKLQMTKFQSIASDLHRYASVAE